MEGLISGEVSWHSTGRSGPFAAACGAYRSLFPDWRGSAASVTGPRGTLVVTVNDFCAHPSRLLDLSDEAFQNVCGPLSLGVCDVTLTPLTLPPTDAE